MEIDMKRSKQTAIAIIDDDINEFLYSKSNTTKARMYDELVSKIPGVNKEKFYRLLDEKLFEHIKRKLQKRNEDLEQAVDSIEAVFMNTCQKKPLNESLSILNFLIKEKVRSINLEYERELAADFINSFFRNLSDSRYEEIVYEARLAFKHILENLVNELEEEYSLVMSRQLNRLRDKYKEYSSFMDYKVETTLQERPSLSEARVFDSVLSTSSMGIEERDNELFLVMNGSESELVKESNNVIKTIDDRVKLIDEGGVITLYDRESDLLIKSMKDGMGYYKLSHSEGGFEITLEPDFLDYDIKIDNKLCKTKEEKLDALLLIKREFPQVFNRISNNLLFNGLFNESGYTDDMVMSDERYQELIEIKEKENAKMQSVLDSLDIASDEEQEKQEEVNNRLDKILLTLRQKQERKQKQEETTKSVEEMINELNAEPDVQTLISELELEPSITESPLYSKEKSEELISDIVKSLKKKDSIIEELDISEELERLRGDEALRDLYQFVDSNGMPYEDSFGRKVL